MHNLIHINSFAVGDANSWRLGCIEENDTETAVWIEMNWPELDSYLHTSANKESWQLAASTDRGKTKPKF